MFTGIIEEAATVASIREGRESIELAVEANLCSKSAKVGDSVAVNGCCLTIAKLDETRNGVLHFDLLKETWKLMKMKKLFPKRVIILPIDMMQS